MTQTADKWRIAWRLVRGPRRRMCDCDRRIGRGLVSPGPCAPGAGLVERNDVHHGAGPAGWLDRYIAALNQRYGQGVTRREQWQRPLLADHGSRRHIESSNRGQFFKRLGIPSLAVEGDYFISLDKFVEQTGEPPKVTDDDRRAICRRPRRSGSIGSPLP